MDFMDRLTLDAPRLTRDGYMVASVRAARTGIQIYTGREVDPENEHGMRDKAEVRVYRSPDEVFHKDAIASMAHRPITIDHPPVPVTSENVREYQVGITDGEIMRDGEFARIPMLIMDAEAIRAVDGGKREISQGYSCTLDWTPGTNDGQAFDCQQRTIRANHTAIVDFARGGSSLKIGDTKMPKSILIDGHNVEVSDAAAIAVAGLESKLADANGKVATLTTQATTDASTIAKLTTDLATSAASIVTLTKQVADAAITPDKLRDAAAAYSRTVSIGKALGVNVTDAMDEPAIQKAAVSAKLGDAAKDWTPAQIATSFATLAASLPAGAANTTVDSLAHGVSQIVTPTLTNDATKARNERLAHLANAHLGNQSDKTN